MESSYAKATAVEAAPSLDLKKIQVQLEEITKSEQRGKVEYAVKLVLPEKAVKGECERTVVSCTQWCSPLIKLEL